MEINALGSLPASQKAVPDLLGTNVNCFDRRLKKEPNFYRYALKRVVESIMYDPSKKAPEQHRSCWCHRGMLSSDRTAAVFRNKDGTNARFGGLVTCSSVWVCPICANKISNKRQRELQKALLEWHKRNTENRCYLLTLTFPHEKGMVLVELLALFAKALAKFKACKTFRRIMGKDRRAGSVRSLEVTVGEHGWHPHTHDLVFALPGMFQDAKEIDGVQLHPDIDRLKAAWFDALFKAGLCEQRQLADVLMHGLDVRGGQYAADYVAKFGREQKWGLSREVTMHVAKTGSDAKGAHPFQLLEWADKGDALAADQFREYAAALDGKRMLSWSPGLKKMLLDVEDNSDEEAAQEDLGEEEMIGIINASQLSILTSRKLFPAFLIFIAKYCFEPTTGQSDIDEWFEQERGRERTASGVIRTPSDPAGWAVRGNYFSDAEREEGAQ